MAASDWVPAKLRDLIDIRHGFAFDGEYFRDEPPGYVLLTPGNFAIGGGFKRDKFKYYVGPVPEDFVLGEGDLLVTMTDLSKAADTLGYPALVPSSRGFRFLHNQRLGRVLIRPTAALRKDFLYFLLRSRPYRNEVLASATGTTVKHTSPERIRTFEFMLAPLDEQRAIALILGTLDDKLELNQRMNETLEAMARAIFKSWFVDFDPVHAKAESRQPSGMDAATAALFPDSFEDSTLGKIPRGWRVGKLGDVLSVIETGGRPKGGVSGISEGLPSVGAESIVGLGLFDYSKTKFVPRDFFQAMNKGHVQDRDVLLYKDGGRPGVYEPHLTMIGDGFPFEEFCINEHVYRLRTDPAIPQCYLYFWLASDLTMDEMRTRGTGVAIPGLNSTSVRELTVLHPSSPILHAFDHSVSPSVQRIFCNCKESHTLSRLRDTLLPKLISGEIRLKNLENYSEKRA